MNILHVISTLALGGAQRLVIEWAAGMQRMGHRADIAVLYRYETAFDALLQAHGVRTLEPGGDLKRYLSWNGFRLLQRYASHYDIIHAHLFPGQLYVAPLRCPTQAKVTTEHDTSNRRRGKWWWRPADRWLYHQYDGIFAISAGVKAALCREVGVAPHRVQVIHNGIAITPPLPRSTSIRQHLGIPDDATVICMIARMEAPKKQHRLLLEALALLQHEGDYHVILAGDGPSRPQLEQQTDALNLRQRVHFLGVRSDVQHILANADIAATLATWEGFSMSALEALAQGTPVIASDVPGMNEVVQHGQSGFLIDNNAPETLISAIRRLSQSHELRQQMGAAGMARAKHFSIERSTQQYLDAYHAIAAARR